MSYTINDIESLTFCEGVRQKIAMYLGSADMQGVYNAVQEIISNSIDEFYMGYGDKIEIGLGPNNIIVITDKERGVPCDTFKRAKISEEEFAKKMAQDTVKVLTIHTSKGPEVKYVVVIGAKNWSSEEKRIQYVAATRAMDFLLWTTPKPKKKKKYVD